MDESRFGLKGVRRRKITLRGVKPIGQYCWRFEYFYAYGAVEPTTGESYYWIFNTLDGKCFEGYLQKLSEAYAESFLVLLLDNSGCHKAKGLQIPENIFLLFQPAYSPELNPIERVWEYLKSKLSWKMFKDLEELEDKVCELMVNTTNEVIASLSGYPWILDSLKRAGIS